MFKILLPSSFVEGSKIATFGDCAAPFFPAGVGVSVARGTAPVLVAGPVCGVVVVGTDGSFRFGVALV